MCRWMVAMALVAALAAGPAAQAAPTSVELVMKGNVGDEATYRTWMVMEMSMVVTDPQSGAQVLSVAPRVQGSATTVSRVEAVSPDGDLTFTNQLDAFSVDVQVAELHLLLALEPKAGGPRLIKLPPLPLRSVVDKRGKLVAIEGLEKLSIPLPGMGGKPMDLGAMLSGAIKQFAQPMYPDRQLKVGDSWSWEMVVDPGAMAEMLGMPMPPQAKEQMAAMRFPIRSTSTLVGFEQLAGVECAKIESDAPWELTMPVGPPGQPQGTMQESGSTRVTSWFDYQAGREVRRAVDGRFDMTIAAGGATPVKMSMTFQAESELVP